MTTNESAFVKEIFSKDSSGHDYYHTLRVYKPATQIVKLENADINIVCYNMVTLFKIRMDTPLWK